ncbi:MAG: PAS domain S-box protein [candidate division Zixibacteria bacterium]|nr:PAS domain S-box protein [candidate division Zixibacteria bacterium]
MTGVDMDKAKIIYIEDNRKQREELTILLEEKGYSVLPFASGEKVLEKLDSFIPDIILCDLNMPGLSGIDILKEVNSRFPDLPFIMLSAHGSVKQAVDALQRGADHFILKPFEFKELENDINQCLEKRRLRERLKQSEAYINRILDNIPDILYSLDENLVFTNVSPSSEERLGYKPSEIIGKTVFDVIHPDDREGVRRRLTELAKDAKETETTNQFRLVSKSGEAKYFEVKGRILFSDGKFAGTDGIVRDISERIKLEQQLKEHAESLKNANEDLTTKARKLQDATLELGNANVELLIAKEKVEEKNKELERVLAELGKKKDELQTILNMSPEVVIMTDLDGAIKTANESIKNVLGIDQSEVSGKNIVELWKSIENIFEDKDSFYKLLRKLEESPDSPDKLDYHSIMRRALNTKKPQSRALAILMVPIRDRDRRETGRLWLINDITELKHADEQLHALVEVSPVPLLVSRVEDGRILFANQPLIELMGMDNKDVLGEKTTDYYHDPSERAKVLKALKEHGFVKNFELRLKKTDGTPFYALLSLTTTKIGGKTVIMGGVHDINERKQAEIELEKERNFVSAVLEMAGDLVVVLDPEGKIVRFNRACEQLSGYKFAEVFGKTVWDTFIIDEEKPVIESHFKGLLNSKIPVKGENHWRTKSGELRLISWTNSSLYDQDGNLEYIIATGVDITEKKEAEEKLKLYREIYKDTSDGVAVIDKDGKYIDANPALCEFMELSHDELVGKTPEDVFGFDMVRDIKDNLFKKGYYRGEKKSRFESNKDRYYDISVFEVKNDDGQLICYASMSRDITDRKQAEEVIATRLRYEEALAKCSQALLTKSEDAVQKVIEYLLEASQVSRVYIFENFEDEEDGLCMRQKLEVCAPEAVPQIDNPELQHIRYKEFESDLIGVLSSNEPFMGHVEDLREPLRSMLQAQHIISILILPIMVEGEFHGLIGFDNCVDKREWNKEDIRSLRTAAEMIGVYVERERAQETLRVSEERFRSLVENANDVIYSTDGEGKITYLSPKFKDATGYEAIDFLGKPIRPLMHPDNIAESDQWYSSGLEAGEHKRTGYEFRLKHKSGEWKWFVSNSSVLKDDEGNVREVIGVAHDITEMKKVLEDLEEANKNLRKAQLQLIQSEKMASLGMLVAGIAHEINTPIGAVNSMHDTLTRAIVKLRDLIRLKYGDDAELDEKLKSIFDTIDKANQVIDSGSKRVRDIVRRLRSFARLDEAELKTVDIHEGIEDTLTLIHHEIKHRLSIKKDYGDIPRISCYPGQLNQVFLNLFVNSNQAIEDKGEIVIKTSYINRRVIIEISDNGRGIPENKLERIFDPGFTTKGVGIGTGLGLSIVYQIIQDHHGFINVTSEEGKGTKFTISLPDDLDKRLGHNNKEKEGR